MSRIISVSVAALMMPAIVLLSLQAKAQQANFRQTQDAAMAAAAGPEFQRTGFATIGLGAPERRKLAPGSGQSSTAGPAKASGPFPPQPYRPSRTELQTADQEPQRRSSSGGFRVDDDATGYSPQLEARANAVFGKGNVGNEPARQQWMADQEQRDIENEINRSKALLYPVGAR